MDRYFTKFPVITYNDTQVVDITRRVKIADADYRVPNLFYPVEIKAGLRPDILADKFYEDTELDWLVNLSNKIIDPYYDWYLSEADFEAYIVDKYDSYELARKKIKFWRNNWPDDSTEISPTYYQNHVALDLKKYYSPRYGTNGKIMTYRRKQADWQVNTNKVYQYDITYTSGNTYTEGELLDIKDGSTVVGTAECITSNSTALIVQHIVGNATANSTWSKTILGETSNVTATSVNSTVLQDTITDAENVFWTPVTYYDWEFENNEKKKHVYLLNPSVVRTVSNDIRKKLRE